MSGPSPSKVFVITGPSGVGKGSLISLLRHRIPELELSTSATTREPRTGEQHGVDYHFLDKDEFLDRVEAGEFLEHAAYSGNHYGTLRSEVDRRIEAGSPVVLEIEVQGARQIAESMPEAVQIFIAPPALESLKGRLEGRGTDSPEAIARRLEVAEEELAARDEFHHQVVNDELEHALDELEAIVRGKLSQSSQ
ncbi:MAG: guanylate kinase [Solirubrobacterales bacterium]|nr:guanylate kinase [Solirubrobacterales bacterium]OJU94882.1 MAG: guanylate kinase [Solirubrobacterales bacterium 67-14]